MANDGPVIARSSLYFAVSRASDQQRPDSNHAGNGNGVNVIVDRVALIDKNVDGRTGVELDEAEQRAYDIAFGAGGRYAGDTWACAGQAQPAATFG